MSPSFHAATIAWLQQAFAAPTEAQAEAWDAIEAGHHTLIAAPTGSGKTLAAFLSAINDLVRQGLDGTLDDSTQVVYVSPLKALSNDIQRNLAVPLAGIQAQLAQRGLPEIEVRTWVRTGDTPAGEREAMRRRPPHIVVTTPESLYLLLTSEGGRRMLGTIRTVIIDEIHALAASKRGAHLTLSLERLEALTEQPLNRIGLSATQRPIEKVAQFLVGQRDEPCTIVDKGHVQRRDLALELPSSPLEAVMANEVWEEIYDRLAELVNQHRTTLIFANTRRQTERVARHLSERLSDDQVTSHHGSLSKERRLAAEQQLKHGELKALVATASLELGIDIGNVDLVCQLGSTRTIANFLQRVGRAGHSVGGTSKGRLFPLSRDDLVECAALIEAIGRDELDELTLPEAPLEVLAQQLVAELANQEWDETALLERVRRAYPYRALSEDEFLAVVTMLAEGFTTRRGRRSAYIHRDAVNRRLRGRRGARLTALTCGGTIADRGDFDVVLEPAGQVVGSVNEDFALESLSGDIFQLGNTSYRVLKIEGGKVRVEDAHGLPPGIPFWFGEAPARTPELSAALCRIRQGAAERDPDSARAWLMGLGLPPAAVEQLVNYLTAGQAALGAMPSLDTVVLERFFDEAGDMHLVIHAPFGSRLNRAWGLALRKRFCRKFNFELQAAATENAIILSLTTTHSFPLDEVARYLNSQTVRGVLTQALLDAPMFVTRWRWNATTALAVKRFRGGKRAPPQLQRMEAEDLMATVFPDQMACRENIPGDREIPDHPLVSQTLHDCLVEAMDVAGLEQRLHDLEQGRLKVVTAELTEPSPFAQEILSARPYAYLDDAPLEERRTLAVQSRRWMDPETAADLGRLDAEAIARVRQEAWPEVRDADELHDALMVLGYVTAAEGEAQGWQPWRDALGQDRRAAVLGGDDSPALWVAAERLPEHQAVRPSAATDTPVTVPGDPPIPDPHQALVELVRSRLQGIGPTTTADLATTIGATEDKVEQALSALEGEGFVLQGQFTTETKATEWCERGLLARIHRYTIKRLRREIEPVAASDFLRFLTHWQRLTAETRGEGPEALAAVLDQLEGFPAAAGSWEEDLLPARLDGYDPAWLDQLCLSGRVTWARLSAIRGHKDKRPGPVRTTPVTIVSRVQLPVWTALGGTSPIAELPLSSQARQVLAVLQDRGALFFDELADGSRLLRSQAENALGELTAWGLVSADSFKGLRALLTPDNRRRGRQRRQTVDPMQETGRWALLRRPGAEDAKLTPEALESIARTLLRRYGVVFRRLMEREPLAPTWRQLMTVYRRLEARGEVRGGRFIAGMGGEHFALPEAVSRLRELRRQPATGELVSISGADPLNLIGLVTPGNRLPATTRNRLLYEDGIPVALRIGGDVDYLGQPDEATAWRYQNVLIRRPDHSRRPRPSDASSARDA